MANLIECKKFYDQINFIVGQSLDITTTIIELTTSSKGLNFVQKTPGGGTRFEDKTVNTPILHPHFEFIFSRKIRKKSEKRKKKPTLRKTQKFK